ncbi:hypothetical protein MIS45_09695 [Wielerella bovis]|uniref:hypothetical protein n=1 Tax=Wielerella bovis TaxID=2917790 RepID=UPI0020186FBE|nr:hypothetical protein [Wielerella bovis]ULJ69016.1 hypothetical protein MIS45_09695 [Wielerella bovis]
MTTLDFQNYEYFTHAVTVGGKILEVPLRKGQKDSAFIDALTFTIKKQTIDINKGLCITDLEYVAAYSEILQDIFGFGVSEKAGKGRYFYNAFYRLGTKETEYGTLHIGGQRETILIELTGIVVEVKKQYKATTSAVCENTSGRWQRCNDFSILRLYRLPSSKTRLGTKTIPIPNPSRPSKNYTHRLRS